MWRHETAGGETGGGGGREGGMVCGGRRAAGPPWNVQTSVRHRPPKLAASALIRKFVRPCIRPGLVPSPTCQDSSAFTGRLRAADTSCTDGRGAHRSRSSLYFQPTATTSSHLLVPRLPDPRAHGCLGQCEVPMHRHQPPGSDTPAEVRWADHLSPGRSSSTVTPLYALPYPADLEPGINGAPSLH